MSRLAEYDPYAIKTVDLTIRGTTKHSSFKSLICTIVIVILAVILNLSIIQELWLPRSQLSTQNFTLQHAPIPISYGAVCFTSTVALSGPYAYNSNNQTLSPLTNLLTRVKLAAKINGAVPYCYDLAGETVQSLKSVKIGATNAPGRLKFYIQTINSFYASNFSEAIDIWTCDSEVQIYFLDVMQVQIIYNDQLAANYDPETLVGINYKQFRWDLGVSAAMKAEEKRLQISMFSNRINLQRIRTDNLVRVTFKRSNVNFIASSITAWVTLLATGAAMIILPLVEQGLKLELSKALYSHKDLESIQPSFLVFLRTKLAFFFPQCLKESVVLRASKRTEEDLEITKILKNQLILTRLVSEISTIHGHIEFPQNQIELEDSQIGMGNFSELLAIAPAEENASAMNQCGQVQQRRLNKLSYENLFDGSSDEPPSSIMSYVHSFLCFFDQSSCELNLLYRKGKGIGSVGSLLMSLAGFIAFTYFLISLNTFQFTSSMTIYKKSLDLDRPYVVFNPNDLIVYSVNVFAPFIATPKWEFKASVIDGEYKTIRSVAIGVNEECSIQAQANNLPTNGRDSIVICLKEPVKLKKSMFSTERLNIYMLPLPARQRPPKSTLYFREVMDAGEAKFIYVWKEIETGTSAFFASSTLVNFNYQPYIGVAITNRFPGSSSNQINDQVLLETDYLQRTQITTIYAETDKGGISLSPGNNYVEVDTSTDTIWDVINNAWGLTALALSVVLYNIGYFFNNIFRPKALNMEDEQSKYNIVMLLANNYKLLTGVHAEEMAKTKYYFKSKLHVRL